MKKTFLLIFLFITTFSFAQKSVDARIILVNNDTIYTKLKVTTNFFQKKLIEPKSFYTHLTILDQKGKEKTAKIDASEVKELHFIDFKDKERFFSHYSQNNDRLIEVLFNGQKIKWYRRHYVNSHDGAMKHHDFLLNTTGEVYNMGLLSNVRKKLKKATESKPELAETINKMKVSDLTILEILQQYEIE